MEQFTNSRTLSHIALHVSQIHAAVMGGIITLDELEQVPKEQMMQSILRGVHSDPCIIQIIKDRRSRV
ncbi:MULTISPECIES: hypothetical protein [Aeromonas]|uniref:hypothetical protein n=1 Tax=Aeromonas TaxID=642 RepID=UPI0005B30C32|nr:MULTISPECIES: hypothetical protein [Aeromonas]TNH76511.1 hypothetical protein CF142_04365 [Aeromonas caviae]